MIRKQLYSTGLAPWDGDSSDNLRADLHNAGVALPKICKRMKIAPGQGPEDFSGKDCFL